MIRTIPEYFGKTAKEGDEFTLFVKAFFTIRAGKAKLLVLQPDCFQLNASIDTLIFKGDVSLYFKLNDPEGVTATVRVNDREDKAAIVNETGSALLLNANLGGKSQLVEITPGEDEIHVSLSGEKNATLIMKS